MGVNPAVPGAGFGCRLMARRFKLVVIVSKESILDVVRGLKALVETEGGKVRRVSARALLERLTPAAPCNHAGALNAPWLV